MADQNKKLVHDIYGLAFNRHQLHEAAKLYFGDRHVQHNPFVANGVAPFVEHIKGYFRTHPKSQVVFSHILADADLVVLHMNSKAHENDRGRAIVDIFRVENVKMVEHWDVAQDVPEKTASGNTML